MITSRGLVLLGLVVLPEICRGPAGRPTREHHLAIGAVERIGIDLAREGRCERRVLVLINIGLLQHLGEHARVQPCNLRGEARGERRGQGWGLASGSGRNFGYTCRFQRATSAKLYLGATSSRKHGTPSWGVSISWARPRGGTLAQIACSSSCNVGTWPLATA